MKDSHCWARVAVVLMGMGAIFCVGCGTPDTDGGPETLAPVGAEVLPGDYPLDKRPVDGTRITSVDFENVLFKFDSSKILDSELGKIERVADYLRKNRRVRVVTEGHCDERGSNEYNMSLGEYRALAVRANLIRLGVESTRVQTRSYGEERPLDPRHNEGAWRLNRRVEFVLYR